MKETIRMKKQIQVPTSREQVALEALRELPEVSVENIPGWSAHVEACNCLAAAEAMVKDAESAMHESAKTIRAYISANWKPEEVSENVRSVMMVW